jgi:hypothetical protein
MMAARVRCFWKWPIGHRWVFEHAGSQLVKRCQTCGRRKGLRVPRSATDLQLPDKGGVE